MSRLEPVLLLAAAGLVLGCTPPRGHASSAVVAPSPSAPSAPQCSTTKHRQFDFWIGTWAVATPDGRVAGTNRIERVLGGCALLEQWSGAGGSRGMSLNYWDAAEGAWFQSWIDNQGQPLRLRGGLRDGRMVLEAQSADSGRVVVQRISWTPLAADRVRQHWERSDDGGRTWVTVFDGNYARERSEGREKRE